MSFWFTDLGNDLFTNNYFKSLKAVIYIFRQASFSADVYLDDFYGAECPSLTDNAFATLQSIFHTQGLAFSPEKDSPPAFVMVCLGILVNSKDFTLRVPESRLREYYPMSYICGCHASALPSKNCSLFSVNFLS